MNTLNKSQEKLSNSSFLLKAIFWALVVVFVFIVGYIMIPIFSRYMSFYFIIVSGIIFFLLGIALIFLSVREKIDRLLKKFLILTGASAIGIPIGIILHNLFYALFILLFGADFWERTGLGDEPFFFILALIVCPIAFLVGVMGSIVRFLKTRK
ncbi:MAG: hypothetical protein WBA71_04095 [Candidatus Humimicrobiia bacterium]